MAGGSPAIEQPGAPRVAESTRPNFNKPSVESPSAGFERIAQEHKAGILNTREALAGIAGWRAMGKADAQIIRMNSEITHLQAIKRIDEKVAADFFLRIDELSRKMGKLFTPRLNRLETVVSAHEKPGEVIEPFLRDLNFHTIKADIKAIEAKNDPEDKPDLDVLRKDLALAEGDRSGLNPADDEMVKLALKIMGARELPAKFKDAPLDAIEDYFSHQNIGGILKSDRQVGALAVRLGLTNDQVRDLVTTYGQGKQLEKDLKALSDEIVILDPEKGKGLRRLVAAKGAGFIATLVSAITAYSMYTVTKKEKGTP